MLHWSTVWEVQVDVVLKRSPTSPFPAAVQSLHANPTPTNVPSLSTPVQATVWDDAGAPVSSTEIGASNDPSVRSAKLTATNVPSASW